MPTSRIIGLDNQSIIIDALLNNNEVVINRLYAKNYPKIEAMILKNNGNKQDAKDVYQEAFVALWKKVREKSFEIKNESAVDGYLYQVSKNKWMDHLRSAAYKKNSSFDLLTENGFERSVEIDVETDDVNAAKLAAAISAFKNLGDECKKLLQKFYYEKKSMNEIADELLLDPASTRNKKYRCMNKLRDLTLNNL